MEWHELGRYRSSCHHLGTWFVRMLSQAVNSKANSKATFFWETREDGKVVVVFGQIKDNKLAPETLKEIINNLWQISVLLKR